MRVSGVTHVDVTTTCDIYRSQFIEVGEKEYINSENNDVWNLIISKKFADYFMEFITDHNLKWNQRSSWNMKDSEPSGIIRSRCASLEVKLLTS